MTWRDVGCGEPRTEHVGKTLTLAGWAARRRDHGGLVFVDLRDQSGLMQLVVNPERSLRAAEAAKEIRNEFVLQATGEVVARATETVNPKMETGEVELQVDELTILSRSSRRRSRLLPRRVSTSSSSARTVPTARVCSPRSSSCARLGSARMQTSPAAR